MEKTKYTILIICEGESTEPLFFNSIRDALLNKEYCIGDVNIRIKPEPKLEYPYKDEAISPHQSIRKVRQTKPVSVGVEPVEINAPLPLKWVLEAQKELEDGTCDEAWAVFDHDDHPARKEAFEAAGKKIKGTTVKLCFSSRSFEYYLLLHFERIFKCFETSECRDKKNSDPKKRKKIIECSTDKHVDDCHGLKCIGGYARSKGFWKNSKDERSTFDLVKNKLEIGFENSAWLRYVSDILDGKEMFDRNPYVTVDSLVKRLTGYADRNWVWLPTGSLMQLNKCDVLVHASKKISITNHDTKTLLISANSFHEVKSDNTRSRFGSQGLVCNGDTVDFPIVGDDDSWFLLELDDNYRLMFGFNNNIGLLYLSRILYSLSHKELNEVLNLLRSKRNR